jgi:hypothetical protein
MVIRFNEEATTDRLRSTIGQQGQHECRDSHTAGCDPSQNGHDFPFRKPVRQHADVSRHGSRAGAHARRIRIEP